MTKIVIKLLEADINESQQTIKKLYLLAEKDEIVQLFDSKLVLSELQLKAGLKKTRLLQKQGEMKANNVNLEFLRVCLGKSQIGDALKMNDLEKAEKLVLFAFIKGNEKKIDDFVKNELNAKELSLKGIEKDFRKKALAFGITEKELEIVSGKENLYEDKCRGRNVLEYSCSGNSVASEEIECADVCVDGACVSRGDLCTDTDSGKNAGVKGTRHFSKKQALRRDTSRL